MRYTWPRTFLTFQVAESNEQIVTYGLAINGTAIFKTGLETVIYGLHTRFNQERSTFWENCHLRLFSCSLHAIAIANRERTGENAGIDWLSVSTATAEQSDS